MSEQQWAFITVSILALIVSVIILALELTETKRAQRAMISLQLYQQLHDPVLQDALARVRAYATNHTLGKGSKATNYLSNGQHTELNGHSAPENVHALIEINHYFTHVGRLMRRHDVDEEVFVLLGPIISEMWHTMRPLRSTILNHQRFAHSPQRDDFEWLYTEWLNWDYHHRDQWTTLASAESEPPTPVASHI